MKTGSKKQKLLYLMKILMEETDENNAITIQQIISKLDAYGIEAERKSLYDDIETLREFGVDVNFVKHDRNGYYNVVSRQFELAELKLLVDSVQSARFITEKKSNELIKKIEGLASRHEASELQHQVFVTERVKSQNEKILYNIDAIHRAIENNRTIKFKYFKLNVKKRPEFRHDGKVYELSPWAMTLVEENYYLVAYDREVDKIKYFRVDKMSGIEMTENPRSGQKVFNKNNIVEYVKKRFRMYDGEECTVRLRCENSFADVILDRFGKDVMIHEQGDGYFEANVEVALSPHFFGWVMAMNDHVVIAGPAEVRKKAKEFIKELAKTYK
ncbi:MAG: WYL domain-containing protein [Lachnospiraceae bacterium]|nr:WYL domain-containing protein [Lachnospiraceae bacterium]